MLSSDRFPKERDTIRLRYHYWSEVLYQLRGIPFLCDSGFRPVAYKGIEGIVEWQPLCFEEEDKADAGIFHKYYDLVRNEQVAFEAAYQQGGFPLYLGVDDYKNVVLMEWDPRRCYWLQKDAIDYSGYATSYESVFFRSHYLGHSKGRIIVHALAEDGHGPTDFAGRHSASWYEERLKLADFPRLEAIKEQT